MSAARSTEKSPASPRRSPRPDDGRCELCGRRLGLSFHHLIPRRNHAKPWFRQAFGLVEMRSRGAWFCRGCHDFVHDHFDENRLGRELNTVAALKAQESVARHVEWAARQRVRGD